MITLQCSTEHALDSAAIRLFTNSLISHVDTVLPDGDLLGARLHCDGAPKPGVQIRPPDYAPFSTIVRYQVDLPPANEKIYYDAILSQVGKPYDWRSIGNFLIRRNWRDPSGWFCSELKAWAFEQAYWPLLNADTPMWCVTPRDLTTSIRMKRTVMCIGRRAVSEFLNYAAPA